MVDNRIILVLVSLMIWMASCNPDEDPVNKCTDLALADFTIEYSNGGIPPELVTLRSIDLSGDAYFWEVNGQTSNGPTFTVSFNETGVFDATLEVQKGMEVCDLTRVIEISPNPLFGSSAIFVDSDGTIYYKYLDNPGAPQQAVGNVGNMGLKGLAYDEQHKKLYYSGSIFRSNMDGSANEQLIEDPASNLIDLDPSDNVLLYATIEQNSPVIKMADLDGNNPKTLHDGFFRFDFMTVSHTHNIVFFVDAELSYEIGFLQYGVDPVEPEFASFGDFAEKKALAYDDTNGYLYYAEGYDVNVIKRVAWPITPNSIGEIVVEFAGNTPVLGLDIDEKVNHLYWTYQKGDIGAIHRLDLNDPGAEVETVFEGEVNPKTLQVIHP